MQDAEYQLIIIGGGPAGLTAGLYAGRGRLKTLLLERAAIGGQALITDWIENYPGFPEGISGFDLIEKMTGQAKRFGLETRFASVTSLHLLGTNKTVVLESGEHLSAQTIILCTGARPAKLGIPGETELTGKGVSYCATCDGPFFKNQEIAVVGGGNTALQEAIYLTKFARKVNLIHRRNELRATKALQEKAFANNKIEFFLNSRVTEIHGEDGGVQRIDILHTDGGRDMLQVTGVFIFIGTIPNNEMLPMDQLAMDQHGFVVTGAEMETNLPGVFAAGDIRSKNFRQIVNAAGEGAVAELSAEEYLGSLS